MPGAFHTEVVQNSEKQLSVYLLDMEWAKPTIQNSSVSIVFRNNKKENKTICTAKRDHFECKVPPSISLKSGEITINASRGGAVGGASVHKLPLGFSHE